MDFGNTSVNIISDGTFLPDGGSMFGQVPKTSWEHQIKPDRKNRIRLSLNCLLIQTPQANILIDTGAGSKKSDHMKERYGLNGNKLLKEIKKFGLTPREIDKVILTHLHFESVGGCTKLDRGGQPIPVFQKAEHLVQRACFEEAQQPNERNQKLLYPDDFVPLNDSGLLTLLDGDTEIAPGIYTRVTNAHAIGHQIVFIELGSERIMYMGGLIPTHFHLNPLSISAFDQSAEDTLREKRKLIELAIQEGWLVIFNHALEKPSGYLEQRNGTINFSSREI